MIGANIKREPVRFPGPSDRTAIIGRTGSGKTTKGVWHLLGYDYNTQPWLIVNTKGDPLLNEIAQIPGVQSIGVDDTPGERGLYIVSPVPDQGVELDAMFGRIWAKQNCGIYIDEGYMIDVKDKFNACLTQGRTRRIPMIVLSQRPAWITKFVFSEADYFSIFNLQRFEDRKTVAGFVPVDPNYKLERYCSYWYNVGDDRLVQFGPVPGKDQLLKGFRAKFPPEQAQEGELLPAPDSQDRPRVKRVV